MKAKLQISEDTTEANLTGLWRAGPAPKYIYKKSPCRIACPLEQVIPEALRLVRNGKIKDAWELWTRSNPLPTVSGRVCRRFCETECNRGNYDESVNIGDLEKFLGDKALENDWTTDFPSNSYSKNRIAVIGAGPAGLAAAYFLRKEGLKLDIFEKEKKLGGFMRLIPEWRLPRDVLDKEIENILKKQNNNEVTVARNIELNENFIANSLKNYYSAVIIATGAQKRISLNLRGENSPKVIHSLDFLAGKLSKSELKKKPSKIIVIGGGDTAMDTARSAKRLFNSAEIKIVCRENEENIPAQKEELQAAFIENIAFRYCAQPIEIRDWDDYLKVGFLETENYVEDNRLKFLLISHYFSEMTDWLIIAAGAKTELPFFIQEVQKEKFFIVGDALNGPSFVAKAIASAKNVIPELLNFLKTGKREPDEKIQSKAAGISDINLAYFEKRKRSACPEEAERCFGCGMCVKCRNCEEYCPDLAVLENKKGEYEIDENYCKGCGICAKECPTGIIATNH